MIGLGLIVALSTTLLGTNLRLIYILFNNALEIVINGAVISHMVKLNYWIAP